MALGHSGLSAAGYQFPELIDPVIVLTAAPFAMGGVIWCLA
jgi:hypothetical protein